MSKAGKDIQTCIIILLEFLAVLFVIFMCGLLAYGVLFKFY